MESVIFGVLLVFVIAYVMALVLPKNNSGLNNRKNAQEQKDCIFQECINNGMSSIGNIKSKEDMIELTIKLKDVSHKISKLMLDYKMLNENNELLKSDKDNDSKYFMLINKNEEVLRYFRIMYDKYISLSIDLYFNGLVYDLLNEDIKKISIKDKISKLENDISAYIQKYFPKGKTNDEIKILFKHTGETINKIFERISIIKFELIKIQNKVIISGLSPIDVEFEIKKMLSNNEMEHIVQDIDMLNLEYDRFIAEIEIERNQ